MFSIDHIFIWSPDNGKEIELFKDAGFTSIISGSHEGQGTAGEYIFFLNFYIELLFISNNEQAENKFIAFAENYKERIDWRNTNASPFGLGVKLKPYEKGDIPFDFSEYKASWIKEDSIILPVENNDLKNPFIFLVPPYMEFPNYNSLEEMQKDDKPESFKQNHIHPNKVEQLSALKLTTTVDTASSSVQTKLMQDGINIEVGNKTLLELEFDFHRQNKTINLEPELPIIIKY